MEQDFLFWILLISFGIVWSFWKADIIKHIFNKKKYNEIILRQKDTEENKVWKGILFHIFLAKFAVLALLIQVIDSHKTDTLKKHTCETTINKKFNNTIN